MKVELFISKDRVPFIVEELGADRVTVSEYKEHVDRIEFEMTSELDALHMFHAGIKCGSDSMSNALLQK